MTILRGCLGYGGPAVRRFSHRFYVRADLIILQLIKHREAILDLVETLVEKTRSERGYSSAGRLLTRVLHTLSGVYPLNCRFVNLDEWDSDGKCRLHFPYSEAQH